MVKKQTTYDFIQLGRKVNGRIKCNEEYKLETIFNTCEHVVKFVNKTETAKLSWFDKTFKTKKYWIVLSAGEGALKEVRNIKRSFKSMINHDLSAKTTKTTKKGKK